MTPKHVGPFGRYAIVILAVLSFSIPVLAADSGSHAARILSDKYYGAVGGFLVELSTDAAASSGVALGTQVRAEDQLGLDPQQTTYRLFFQGRIKPKHVFGFDYMQIDRTGQRTLSDQIIWNDVTYDVGATVKTKFGTKQLGLDYRYSFVNDGRTEAGVLTGLSTFKFSGSLEGQGSINNQPTQFYRAGEDFVAPVPKVGMFIRYAILDNLIFQANAAFFRVTVGDTLAKMQDGLFVLDYYFSKNVGIGGGVNSTTLLYQNKGDKPVRVEYQQTGVLMYLNFVF